MSPSAMVGTPNADPRSSGVNGSSRPNGLLNGSHPESPSLIHPQSNHTSSDDIFDLVCVGFGPASLAVAIALHDMYKSSPSHHPKVLFLEKQAQFAWHAGMQLPGAKMQISFLKDLATPRDPTSKFTFLNYLLQKGRLHHFINLGTFLPSRMEYEDYLRWCASFFAKEGCVEYGMDVERVGVDGKRGDGKITNFVVCARRRDGEVVSRRTRHVVIAVGGRPVVPPSLQGLKHVHHSSQFANAINKIQEQGMGLPLKFAVIGGGQSAAEIFNDIWARFPGAKVRLIIKDSSLRPSDDSPFVNEIFDPDRVEGIYNQNAPDRAAAIALDRGTNYGVVRLELLEHLYEKLYMQRLRNPDETQWPAQILPNRAVLSASQSSDSKIILKLGLTKEKGQERTSDEEDLEVDYVFAATGYRRNAHQEILTDLKPLLSNHLTDSEKLPVARNYRVQYDEGKVDGSQAGIWLQGCNEETHGLSDTLLSILAVRGGELVQSIFGESGSADS